jgi:gluconate 2-dehydrogenase gamma chain
MAPIAGETGMTALLEIDRRTMLERVLQLTGAAAVGGFSSEALGRAASLGKRFLDAPTFALLAAVAETIVPRTDTPGALDANVPAKFDAMLTHWASPDRRVELRRALLTIDGLARARHGKAFVALGSDERTALLIAHDLAALKIVPRTRPLTGMEAMIASPSYADPGYGKLKELIVLLYYYSEEALTTELTYEHVPGGWTPSVPVTDKTRPSGGIGLF